MARRQPRQLVTLSKQKRVRTNDQSIGSLLDKLCERLLNFTFSARVCT